jgi:hypothetical protein
VCRSVRWVSAGTVELDSCSTASTASLILPARSHTNHPARSLTPAAVCQINFPPPPMLDPGAVVVAGAAGQLGKPGDLLLPRVAAQGPLADAVASASAFHPVQPSGGGGSSYVNGVMAAAGRMVGPSAAEEANGSGQRAKRQRSEGSPLGATDAVAAIAAMAAATAAAVSGNDDEQQQQQQRPAAAPFPEGAPPPVADGLGLGAGGGLSADWLGFAGNPQLAQLQAQAAQLQAQAGLGSGPASYTALWGGFGAGGGSSAGFASGAGGWQPRGFPPAQQLPLLQQQGLDAEGMMAAGAAASRALVAPPPRQFELPLQPPLPASMPQQAPGAPWSQQLASMGGGNGGGTLGGTGGWASSLQQPGSGGLGAAASSAGWGSGMPPPPGSLQAWANLPLSAAGSGAPPAGLLGSQFSSGQLNSMISSMQQSLGVSGGGGGGSLPGSVGMLPNGGSQPPAPAAAPGSGPPASA